MQKPRSPRWGAALGASVAIALVTMGILTAMGRGWWCPAGDAWPWSSDIWSIHNSQHLVDPYSFTHVLHGVLFFGMLRLAGDRWHEIRLLVAVIAESAWEVFENTNAVIEHYRETTISLEYFGDSVVNSGADIAAMGLGYALASRLPWWGSVLVFVATEAVLAWWIRDSLLLNMLMLVCPLDAVKAWQMGA